MMKTKIMILSATVSLALFSGCATTSPTIASHPDSAVSYDHYKSFMMLKPSGLGTARNAAATPERVRRVREATEAAFVAKGLTKSADAYADLLILVHGGVAEKLDIQDWGLGYGRFGRGFAGRQEISQHKEGSLFIDVFDAKTRELIWRGSATAEVTDMPDADKIKAAVDSVVARYPN